MGRIYRRGRTWHGYWTDTKGEPHRRSLRTEDRTVALARLRSLELAATDPAAYSGHTLGEAVKALAVAMATEPEATRESYSQKGRHLVRVLGAGTTLVSLTRDRVREYVAYRLDEEADASTVHKELVVLRRALAEAKERGLWAGEVRAVVPTIKTNYQPCERWLTRDEASALLAGLTPAENAKPEAAAELRRKRLWTAIGLYAGLRDSEICNLKWEHVDGARGWLRAPGTKTKGAWRMIPIAAELAPLLAAAAADAEAHGATGENLVVGAWDNVRRDLPRALDRGLRGGPRRRLPKGQEHPPLPEVTPNDLRRTFASWMVQAGVPLLVVARLLGHSSTRMVERVYGHLSEQSLRSAIDALSGCAAGVQRTVLSDGTEGTRGTAGGAGAAPASLSISVEESALSSAREGLEKVPSPGIEPGTRGFSVPGSRPFSNVIPLRKAGAR